MIKPTQDFLDLFKSTNGALSVTESIAIMNIAKMAKQGTYMELGVAEGKSAMSAAYNLQEGLFFLVDPIFEDEKLREQVIKKVKTFADKKIIVGCLPKYSIEAIELYNDYAYVMVDSGSHQDGLPMQEVKLLEDKMTQGGIIVFHDWDSQFSEVKEASDYLVGTGKYDYIPIDWEEIINYVNENNLEDNNLSWHHQELKNPCFVGAVIRK